MLKLFFAGGFPYFTPTELDAMYDIGIKRRLFSYHFIVEDDKMRVGFNHVKGKKDYEVMMDSGAYSVAMKGVKINIDKYAEFLLENKDHITVAVNLDVVPMESTRENLENGAIEGYENLKYLESKGLKILHVYHSAEDEKWLKKLMDNYEYFGVSKTGDVEGVQQRLDRVFSLLCNKHGKTDYKIHGFGVTSPQMMMRYPWFSTDSSSWIKYGCFGCVVLVKDGKFMTLGMSDRKRTLWAVKGAHYNNLNKEEKKIWDEEMEKRGVDRDMLQDNKTRDMWNIESFLQLEKYMSGKEVLFKPKRSIFSV